MKDIKETQKTIFAAIFSNSLNEEDKAEAGQLFLKTFGGTEYFKGEYYALSVIVLNFRNLDIITESFIETFLTTQKANILSKKRVNIADYGGVDSYPVYVQAVIEAYRQAKEAKITLAEFNLAVEEYKLWYTSRETIDALENAAKTLDKPYIKDSEITNLSLIGKNYDVARRELANSLQKIDNLVNKKDRKGLIDYTQLPDEETKINTIMNYGIKSLDEATGGIKEGQMVSLLAPPKGGKSRIATYFLHQAVIQGKNVLMWSIENGYKGWEAMMRVRHFAYFYGEKNKSGVVGQGTLSEEDMEMLAFSDTNIMSGQYETEDLKEKEAKSWLNLKTASEYGKFYAIDDDFDSDTFLPLLEEYIEQTQADVVCIDYLQLISGTGDAPKNQRIGDAYTKILQLLKKKKIAGIFPGQIKQLGVGLLSRIESDEYATAEFRDIAGESAEVIRTPDVNLLLAATKEDIINNRMQIVNIASRNVKSFEPIKITLELGRCTIHEAE